MKEPRTREEAAERIAELRRRAHLFRGSMVGEIAWAKANRLMGQWGIRKDEASTGLPS